MAEQNTPQPGSIEQFEAATSQKAYDAAWKEAHKSARRGKRVASQVIQMIGKGQTEAKARTGVFPFRHPFTSVVRSSDSVALATNAELKLRGVNANIDIYDASVGFTDPSNELNVVIKSIDGVAQPTSEFYQGRVEQKKQAQTPPEV